MSASAVVLFAHGARDARWAEPFEAVAAQLRSARPGLQVRLAFLELMQPSLPEAVAALADAGCTQVTVVPMFLGAGGHVRRDLPRIVAELRATHPALTIEHEPPLGEWPAMLRAMAAAIAEQVSHPTAQPVKP